MRSISMNGATVGLWKVTERDLNKNKRAYWVCKCLGCGATQSVSGTLLRADIIGGCKSCRLAGNKIKYPLEYAVWQNIKTRVFNSNRPTNKRYSKLGMCKEWVDSFDAFYKYIGPRPSKDYSIDRINNEQGYYPNNVRWATRKEQARNTNRNLIVAGQVLIDFAKDNTIPYNTLRDRYHKNAIQEPRR